MNEEINYIEEIYKCIKNNPGGLTVTDMAEITQFSRNTIHKYIKILLDQDKVFTKKVGPYKQYFSTKVFHLPFDTAVTYYKAIIKNIKLFIESLNQLDSESIVKQIGKNCVMHDDIHFPFSSSTRRQLRSLKGSVLTKANLDAFPQFYTAYDIFQPDINIVSMDSNIKKNASDYSNSDLDQIDQYAIYRIKNSIFLDNSEDYVYHLYLICGITEGLLERATEREVNVNVKEIHIGQNRSESYCDIEIKISPP